VVVHDEYIDLYYILDVRKIPFLGISELRSKIILETIPFREG